MQMSKTQEDARVEIEAACRQAAAEGKRVAVVFGANWCPDCEAFKRALGHRLVKPIVDPNYVVVKDLMAQYGMNVGSGIPSVAVLDPDGSLVISQRDGEFRNTSALLSVAEIVSFFHKWAPGRDVAH
jgi:thiol-disulfide isomerase/thioredoxin